MKDLLSVVSSKGQITLPKTIRDVLELGDKDTVKFTLSDDGKVMLEKGEQRISSGVYSLLDMALRSGEIVVVSGAVATGKSTFIKNFVEECYQTEKVRTFYPIHTNGDVRKFVKTAEIEIKDYDYVLSIPSLSEMVRDGEIDVLVLEEYQLGTHVELIEGLVEQGVKVIIHATLDKDSHVLFKNYVRADVTQYKVGGVVTVSKVKILPSGEVNSINILS